MDMARVRLNAQAAQQLPLSSSPFLLLDHESNLKRSGDYDDEQKCPRDSPKRPSPRVCLILALAVLGAYLCLPSLFLSPASRSAISERKSVTLEGENYEDFTLGGLLSKDTDRSTCKSRGLIHRFRKQRPYSPSPYLLRKLREYEGLHRRCGVSSRSFHDQSAELSQGNLSKQGNAGGAGGEGECRYLVWIKNSGLGNRLVSIAAAFVYSLLTQRVLLLDSGSDLGELLCEPFPGSSWILPNESSLLAFLSFNESSPHTLGHVLAQGTFLPFLRDPVKEGFFDATSFSNSSPPSFLQLDLSHGYGFYDKLFFCDKEQASLNTIPWLFLKSNLYFVPSLYIYIPLFRQELDLLFPEREAIFHHISRYLFFPSNPVWSQIMRFYNAYLGYASHIVGIQVRSFKHPPVYLPSLSKQILSCAHENKLLPKTTMTYTSTDEDHFVRNSTAVLVTSLLPHYHENLREIYVDYATETGEVVGVHQPSHDLYQNTQSHGHNMKAWAEMCLLSFSDTLITSPMSTFGYVAQGLSGLRPWVLTRMKDETSITDLSLPACSQDPSLEPCFHAPPYFDCVSSRGGDTSVVVPYVRKCKDVDWGFKVYANLDV